jgi:putative transposon-encoded protein
VITCKLNRGDSLAKLMIGIPMEKKTTKDYKGSTVETAPSRVKFEIFGEEMLEKEVKLSGNSGRVYIPPTWVGHQVKIVRID